MRCTRASVRLLAQTLADRATVHVRDRRGRGDSGGAPDPALDPTGPDGDALVAAVPGARRRTLPGQGHLVTPAVLAPVLADLLG